jgi:rod shape-determining protein MreC
MSYLLDKKIQRNKYFKIALSVFVLIVLFYFRVSIFEKLSYVVEKVSHPILILGNSVGGKFKNIGLYFVSKNSLISENENLKSQISESQADRANYDSVVAENIKLKEILGRKNEKIPMILAAILSKPNQSVYDTLVVDAGTKQGIKVGDMVFALGDVPIGRVSLVYDNSSKVVLFSNAGEKTQVVISTVTVGQASKDIFLEIVGRGGGNFEMVLPRDLVLQKGDQVVLPGIHPYVLAITETTISDPRDPFNKVLLSSPVNIQGLKFVEIEQ